MTRLFLPVGAPGSGKSSLARTLVLDRLLDERAVVSPDDLREWVTGSRADQSANSEVFGIAHQITRARLRHGRDVWFDATNLPLPLGLIADAVRGTLGPGTLGWRSNTVEVVVVPFRVARHELVVRNLARVANRGPAVPPAVLHKYADLMESDWTASLGTILREQEPDTVPIVPASQLAKWLRARTPSVAPTGL